MKRISYALCFLGLTFALAGCAAKGGDCTTCDKMNTKECGKGDCKCENCKKEKKCDCAKKGATKAAPKK